MSPCDGASRPCTTHMAVELASRPSARRNGCRERGSLPVHAMGEVHVRGEQRRGSEGPKRRWHTSQPLEVTRKSCRGWSRSDAPLLSHAHGALRVPAAVGQSPVDIGLRQRRSQHHLAPHRFPELCLSIAETHGQANLKGHDIACDGQGGWRAGARWVRRWRFTGVRRDPKAPSGVMGHAVLGCSAGQGSAFAGGTRSAELCTILHNGCTRWAEHGEREG
jgi:hypothetical protein